MYDLVTFGEMLLRLGAPGFERIEQATQFNVCVTGGEMNAGVVAARFGLRTAHVTKLPRNPLGRMIENHTRAHGIDTSHFVWSDDGRVGLFFLEAGAMPRTSAVVYDRAHSEMSRLKPGEVDWDCIFKRARLFHFSGTAPALSPSSAAATKEAVLAAKRNKVAVSLDINYRSKLWSLAEASKTLSELLPHCTILITGEGDLDRLFGIRAEDWKTAAAKMAKKFGLETIVLTRREDITVWRNHWTAAAYSGGRWYTDVTYAMDIVDRVGGGDAFTGAFLYAYLAFDKDIKKALQYGNASCALKHSVPGDVNWCTKEEIEALIRRGPGGGTNLRISR